MILIYYIWITVWKRKLDQLSEEWIHINHRQRNEKLAKSPYIGLTSNREATWSNPSWRVKILINFSFRPMVEFILQPADFTLLHFFCPWGLINYVKISIFCFRHFVLSRPKPTYTNTCKIQVFRILNIVHKTLKMVKL